MNPQWYYADASGGQQGPFSQDELLQMVAAGQITPETMLWAEHLTEWTPAARIEGIFPGTTSAPAPVDPYAPPSQTAPHPGDPSALAYPIPQVSKTSFGLYLGSLLLAIALMMIATVAVVILSKQSSNGAATNPPHIEKMAEGGTPVEVSPFEEPAGPDAAPELSSTEAAGGLTAMILFGVAWLSSVFAIIYGYVILYRAWHVLQPGGARTTPGQAVGFLFIPIFSIYWIFVAYPAWAKDWNRIRASYQNLSSAPPASEGLFLMGLILMISVIGAPIGIVCFLMMNSQMCKVINYMANSRALAARQGGMPGFY